MLLFCFVEISKFSHFLIFIIDSIRLFLFIFYKIKLKIIFPLSIVSIDLSVSCIYTRVFIFFINFKNTNNMYVIWFSHIVSHSLLTDVDVIYFSFILIRLNIRFIFLGVEVLYVIYVDIWRRWFTHSYHLIYRINE